MNDDTLRHLITAASLWSYKIAVLVVGYLFTYLGYQLLLKGITGGFKFRAEYKGARADLISASPGIFFTLAGTIIIAVALYKGFMLEVAPVDCARTSPAHEGPVPERAPPIQLPRAPPEGGPPPKHRD